MTWINNHNKRAVIDDVLVQVADLVYDLNQQTYCQLLHSPQFSEIASLWQDLLELLRHNNGELAAFWMTYMDFVEDVVFGLLRASREGNWQLHLHAVRKPIPWCFAYDKLNYARYLSPYLAEMSNLPDKHPTIFEAFTRGQFSVQQSIWTHTSRPNHRGYSQQGHLNSRGNYRV